MRCLGFRAMDFGGFGFRIYLLVANEEEGKIMPM